MTWSALENHQRLRLCTDGAWKCTREGYALCTLGLLGTHWDEHNATYATCFLEQCIAITNGEKSPVFVEIFKSWALSLEKTCGVSQALELVDVVHSDMHKGIRKAIAECFPKAERLLDWAHLIGAVRRPKLRHEARDVLRSVILNIEHRYPGFKSVTKGENMV